MQRGISPKISTGQALAVYRKFLGLGVITRLGLGFINSALQWFLLNGISYAER
jgi:hypothetical protein